MTTEHRSRCVLITGGGSGIGAGLASAFHARGARVVIAGRTRERLEAVAATHPGMEVEVLDVADAAAVTALADRLHDTHPELDTVVSNAGIQTLMDFSGREPVPPAIIAREIEVNLTGLIQVSNAMLPLLRRQPAARLIHVGSGLGYVPLVAAPVYSATKAAVHSFTVALRKQLASGNVQVVEIIPPVVATDLHRDQDTKPPNAMPLDTFVQAAMSGLDAGDDEVVVGLARVLRVASRVAPGLFLKIVNKPRG